MRRIAREELPELARAGGFELADAELADWHDLTEYLLDAFEYLEGQEEPARANVEAERDPGRLATREEDPLGAVVRWCRVRAGVEGPLSGRRIGLKDAVAVAGVPLTCGSELLADYVPAQDSVVTERILRAGGEIVAITNMDYFAFTGAGDTSSWGPTLNPWDRTRTASGSSGGSAAALFYDGIDMTIGADQGGSIRLPAAWCGVVGLKPTHSLVPYTGIAGIDLTFDHAGPMALTVEDAALLLQAIAGKDESDPRQREVPPVDAVGAVERAPDDLRGVRIGVLAESFEPAGCEPETLDAVREVVERVRGLGAEVVEVSVPEHLQAGGIAFAGFVEGMYALLAGGGNGFGWAGRYDPALARALAAALERGAAHSAQIKLVLLVGEFLRRTTRGALYAKAQNLRPGLRAAYDRGLAGVDCLLTPTAPWRAHELDLSLPLPERVKRGWAVFPNTYPTDMTGHPGLSLPLAEAGGLPVGVQLVGRRFDDARLLAIGRTLERALDRRPAGAPAAG